MAGEKFLMMSDNPTGTGSFSLNRRSGSTRGANSVAAGHNLVASGNYSHAEGIETQALGTAAHAEGNKAIAKGNYAHAEGGGSRVPTITTSSAASDIRVEWLDSAFNSAFGQHSHTEGSDTLALGLASHAEGTMTGALADSSHAEGHVTRADNFASHVSGKYNVVMTTGGTLANTTGTAFVVGNGTGPGAKSNAFSVQYNGVVKAKSTITASTTADYAEFFEWLDGNPNGEDRVGYFVTLDGDKIRIANENDEYILGVVSGEPFVLGNGDCDTWTNMHLKDEFRRTIYEPAPKVVPILDEKGNPTGEFEEVEGEFEGTRPKLNPSYDPTQKYISRFDRPEWSPVGMLGVIAVRHDGTAQVNRYVTINADGIATACEAFEGHCYRVIKSNSANVVEIILTSGNGLALDGDIFIDSDEEGGVVAGINRMATRTYQSDAQEVEIVEWAPDNMSSYTASRCYYIKRNNMMTIWFEGIIADELTASNSSLAICENMLTKFEIAQTRDAFTLGYYIASDSANSEPVVVNVINNILSIQRMSLDIVAGSRVHGMIEVAIS